MVYWFFLSAIDKMNGLMNDLMNGSMHVFFSYWMIEWFNEWFNESIFQLLSEIMCSRCIVIFIVDALLFGLQKSEKNCYLQVDALGLGNWEWCEGEEGP